MSQLLESGTDPAAQDERGRGVMMAAEARASREVTALLAAAPGRGRPVPDS